MIDIQILKAAATGRWSEILKSVAGIDGAILDGRHHPCPRCQGTDRFRLIDESAGAVLCNQCFTTRNGDGIAAVQWSLGIGFPEAVKKVAEHLGINNGQAVADNMNIVAEIAQRKRVPLESWKAFGAHAAKRGSFTICRLPMYDKHGRECSHFDLATVNSKLLKGMCAAKKPAGVFLANRKSPAAGETVLLVEGAKDAATLHSLGFQAIGLPTSALAKKFVPLFRDCDVT